MRPRQSRKRARGTRTVRDEARWRAMAASRKTVSFRAVIDRTDGADDGDSGERILAATMWIVGDHDRESQKN